MGSEGRRVVFCLNRIGSLGGVTTAIEGLADLLAAHGWDVSFFGITSARRDNPDSRDLGVLRGRIESRIRGTGRLDGALGRVLTRRAFSRLPAGTVVVFTNVWAKKELDAIGYRGADHGHYLVGQHHGSLAGSQTMWEFDAMLQHYKDLDVFTALCDGDAADFGGHLPVPCVTLTNLAHADVSERLGGEPGRVVSVGRLDPQKDVERVVRLFDRARREAGANWHLHVYGDGPSRASVEAVVEKLDAEGYVRLEGVTTDPLEVFRSAMVSVQASRFEGLPMTILEASAVGTPTVAGESSPGVRDLVGGGRGWLVGMDDDDAFVAALTQAMTDEVENRRRGRAAAEAVLRGHSAAAVYRQWTHGVLQAQP